MRGRVAFLCVLLLFATASFAKEVFLSVGGSANSFFTDARIFNPNNKEITIQAYYLPRGNIDNSGEQPVEVKVAARSMRVFDNVVQSLFNRSDVGAIRLTSPDEFVATQRIYSLSATACSGITPTCTLGQFVPGLDVTSAITRGVLVQLKVVQGQYRTNVGVVNPNNSEARVTWRLYDKSNTLVSIGVPIVMPPYGVIGPTQSNSTFFVENPSGDLSDFFMTFSSDKPVFAYASVLDNATNDGTLVPAVVDVGTDPPLPTTVTITARNFSFEVSPADVHAGDVVKFRLVAAEGEHGFSMFAPDGTPILSIDPVTNVVAERTVTLPAQSGTYQFFCTRFCGEGHFSMNGTMVVNPPH